MTNGINCGDPAPNWWNNVTKQLLVVDLSNLQGIITADFYAEVREANTTTPATVIDVNDAFAIDIHLDLTVSDPLSKLICGYWCISVCLESMCGPNRYRFPGDATSPPSGYCCVLVPFDCSTTYDTTICVPGGVVQEDECGAPYEATVIVTLLSRCRRQGKENADPNDPATYIPVGAAGSVELPLLTFYQDQ